MRHARKLVSRLPFIIILFVALSCQSSPPEVPGEATYVGSKACRECHEDIYTQWANSRHTKMLRKVSPRIMLADFNNRTLEHEGWRFLMYTEHGDYFVREWTPAGTETLFHIDFTLGSKRIQHYLSLRPDGSIRVTFPTWDILTGQWIHGSEIVRGVKHNARGGHEAEPVQIWNKHCWNCHTSQEEEGYDIKTSTYNTTFTEPGINCGMCHGPGSLHVERFKKNRLARLARVLIGREDTEPTDIVNTGKFRPGKRMTDCMQCHTRRIMVKKGFHPGKNYYDYYMPKWIELTVRRPSDPVIWVERHRRFANETLVLQESQCYLKGNATCIDCHDPHQVTIALDERHKNTNVLCLQCHKIYEKDNVLAEHTHHSLEGKGSRCIECHMLLITAKTIKLLQNAQVRDHDISTIPIPERTARYGIPNACNNVCHAEKPLEWVMEWMDKWYPRRPKQDRSMKIFTLAWERNLEAVPQLIELVNDPSEARADRVKAAKFLGEFNEQGVADALIRALDDPDVMIRAEAARSLSELRPREAVEPLTEKLSDENRIVRLNAVFALLKMGFLQMEGPRAKVFQEVDAEYLQFLKEFPTVYDTRVDLGTYLALHKNYMAALQEYKNATKLIPDFPLAHYYIGVTYAQLGQFKLAMESLQETLELDPNFRNTRQLMGQVRQLLRSP